MITEILNFSLFKFIIFQWSNSNDFTILSGKNRESENVIQCDTEERCFFVIQIPVTKIIRKTAIWTMFCFWVSPHSYINWVYMFLMQQSHVQWYVSWYLFCNANNLVFLDFKILPDLPRYLSCLFGLQKLLRHIIVM